MTAQHVRDEDDMGLSSDDIRRVLEALDASSWDEALITVGDVSIAVARNGGTLPGTPAAIAPAHAAVAAPAPAPSSAPAATLAEVPAAAQPSAPPVEPPAAPHADPPAAPPAVRTHVVTAPTVGVFWRAPEPGAAPYVEVGQKVAAGDTMCIVEVMKLMSHVEAPVSGTVIEIHVDNATSVEHGAPLFTIALDED